MKKRMISFIVAFLASLSLVAPVHMLRNQYAEQAYQEHQTQAREHLTFIRNTMQSKLDSSLFYADFFEMVIRQNPDISDTELREYARLIVSRNPIVDHVSIAKDGIVTFVYPYSENESVLGLSIMDEEEFFSDHFHTLNNQQQTFAEQPADSSQDGLKILHRKPVYSRAIGSETLWGFASVTVDFDELVQSTLSVNQHYDYQYGIQMVSEAGEEIIWGNRDVFTGEGVTQPVALPQSIWVIGLMPQAGWHTTNGFFQRELVMLYVLISIIFFLVYFFSLQYVTKRDLSRKDPLTGVYNKHTFESMASRLIRYSSQKNAIFLIDFNDFKQINDKYGHLAGDCVLKTCSQRMRDSVKKSDRVGRIGGDEFMIVTKDIGNEDNLEKIAKRITTHIQRPVRYQDNIIRPSISVGYTITSNVDSFEKLYDFADKNMYENKETYKQFFTKLI